MRFLFGWAVKLAFLGAIYFGLTSGYKIKLPDQVLGYKVPDTAQQWVDRNAQIAEYGKQTKAGFELLGQQLK
jgi:hypothetical protein